VRYPIGGNVVEVEPGQSIAQASANDGTIIVLKPGTYPGNFELRAAGVLIFGAWSTLEGPLSVIEGNVTVLGGNNRMRGVKINGKLLSNANSFSAAFSDIASASVSGNGVSLVRNRFTQGQATVPNSNAVLVAWDFHDASAPAVPAGLADGHGLPCLPSRPQLASSCV
jgi:hypothetical protein